MRATHARATGPLATDLLTIGEIARRSGFAQSAVRYYDDLGLLSAIRTVGGQRRFQRSSLRRLALIRAARNIGLSLEEIAEALAALPREQVPSQCDWATLSDGLGKRLDEQIAALEALRDQLTGCIGCGCMSLDNCAAFNPADSARADGPGAAYLPDLLRRGYAAWPGGPGPAQGPSRPGHRERDLGHVAGVLPEVNRDHLAQVPPG